MKLLILMIFTTLLSSLSFGTEPLTQEQLRGLNREDRDNINRIRSEIRTLRERFVDYDGTVQNFNAEVESRNLDNVENPTLEQRQSIVPVARDTARDMARQQRAIEDLRREIYRTISRARDHYQQRSGSNPNLLVERELLRLESRTDEVYQAGDRQAGRSLRAFNNYYINLGLRHDGNLMSDEELSAREERRRARQQERELEREDSEEVAEQDEEQADRSESTPQRPRARAQRQQASESNTFQDLLELPYSHPCRVSYRAVFVMHTSRDTDELRQRRTLRRHIRRLQNQQRPSEAVIGQVIRSIQRVSQKLTETENALSQGVCDNVPTSKRQIERMSASLRELLNLLIGELVVKAQEMARAGEFPENYRDQVNNFSRRSGGGALAPATQRPTVDDSARGGQE